MSAAGLRWHGFLPPLGDFRQTDDVRPVRFQTVARQSGDRCLICFDSDQILAGLAVLFLMLTALPGWATAYGADVQRCTLPWSRVKGVPAMASITPLHGRRGINNRLLLALPPATLDRILRISEPVSLVRRQKIETVDQPINYIHFINRGLVCATKTMEDGRVVEIAAIGVEGTAEFVALLGMDRALVDMVVHIPGTAIRIGRNAFMEEMENDKPLRQLMQHYVRFGLSEVARHIACNRLHHLDQRCCRWLSIAHDHALSDEFPLTHENLALMLGYQRAGVSIAMASLVKAGFIEHKRGKVIVTNRPGLEAAACECYREMQDELDQFLPPPKKTAQLFEFAQNEVARRR